MKRKIIYMFVPFFLYQTTIQAQSISVTVYVPVEFGVLPPTIPGDQTVSTYENTLGNSELDIDGGNKWAFGTTWGVTVSKSTASWHANLLLDVLRDPSITYLIGGDNYISIPDEPTAISFFSCITQRRARNVGLEHRVRISPSDPPAGTYTSTITYTLVDL